MAYLSLPQAELQQVLQRCLNKAHWPLLERLKLRRLSRSLQASLDNNVTQKLVLVDLQLLEKFSRLREVIVPHTFKVPVQAFVRWLAQHNNVQVVEFRHVEEYVDFAHTLLGDEGLRESIATLTVKTYVTRNEFIKPCIELAKMVNLDLKLYCHNEEIDFSTRVTSWEIEMMADVLEAQIIVFREISVPIETQKGLDQEYILTNKNAFLTARILVQNNKIVPFLQSFINRNHTLEHLYVQLQGTASLSNELFQVLNQVKKLSLKMGTLSNEQQVVQLPNLRDLELTGFVYNQQFPKMPNLSSICLSSMFRSSTGFSTDLNIVSTFTNLTRVQLASSARVDLEEIVGEISALKFLKELNLNFNTIVCKSFDCFSQFGDFERLLLKYVVFSEEWDISHLEGLKNLLQIDLHLKEKRRSFRQQNKQQQGSQQYYLSTQFARHRCINNQKSYSLYQQQLQQQQQQCLRCNCYDCNTEETPKALVTAFNKLGSRAKFSVYPSVEKD